MRLWFATLLFVLLAACSMAELPAPPPPPPPFVPPPPPPPPPPATQTCAGGEVILADERCPAASDGGGIPVVIGGGGGFAPPPRRGSVHRSGVRDIPDRAGAEAAAAHHGARDRGETAALHGSASCAVGAPGCDAVAGRGSFAEPGTLQVGQPALLRFAVGKTDADVSEAMEDAPLARSRRIVIAPRMRVTLEPNPMFKFAATSAEEQLLGADNSAVWTWNVTPLKQGGPYTLQANVTVIGGDGRTIDTYSRTVPVKVKVDKWNGFVDTMGKAKTTSELFGGVFASWKSTLGTLAALIGAVGGLVLAWRKLRGSIRGDRSVDAPPPEAKG